MITCELFRLFACWIIIIECKMLCDSSNWMYSISVGNWFMRMNFEILIFTPYFRKSVDIVWTGFSYIEWRASVIILWYYFEKFKLINANNDLYIYANCVSCALQYYSCWLRVRVFVFLLLRSKPLTGDQLTDVRVYGVQKSADLFVLEGNGVASRGECYSFRVFVFVFYPSFSRACGWQHLCLKIYLFNRPSLLRRNRTAGQWEVK